MPRHYKGTTGKKRTKAMKEHRAAVRKKKKKK